MTANYAMVFQNNKILENTSVWNLKVEIFDLWMKFFSLKN